MVEGRGRKNDGCSGVDRERHLKAVRLRQEIDLRRASDVQETGTGTHHPRLPLPLLSSPTQFHYYIRLFPPRRRRRLSPTPARRPPFCLPAPGRFWGDMTCELHLARGRPAHKEGYAENQSRPFTHAARLHWTGTSNPPQLHTFCPLHLPSLAVEGDMASANAHSRPVTREATASLAPPLHMSIRRRPALPLPQRRSRRDWLAGRVCRMHVKN